MKYLYRLRVCCYSLLLTLCISAGWQTVSAQNYESLRTRQIKSSAEYYSLQRADVEPGLYYDVRPGFDFTSVAVNVPTAQSLQGAYLLAAQDTFFLREDVHQAVGDSIKQSQLIIFESPQREISFFSADISGQTSFSLLNAESGRSEANARLQDRQKKKQTTREDRCSKPQIMPQTEWRAGLPTPSYQRVETVVRHNIVHHSAGSNTTTDFVNTVRNIYLFHTQDRGWSDIGYNFLIARDGTIFQGRSFGDVSLETDDIRGAHFCGQNSGTMGVCLMGNFNTALPSDTSVASLVRLLGWKLDKDNLQPFTTYAHPANSNLKVITAHRNGCATECPGENLYAIMDKVRMEVETYLEEACETPDPIVFAAYPVPTRNVLNVRLPQNRNPDRFLLINTLGQRQEMIASQEENNWTIDTEGLRAGYYVLQVSGPGFTYERKLLLY